MRYMLDTNICIYLIKHKPESVIRKLTEHAPSEICISSVTYAELSFGVEKSMYRERNRIALMMMLANIEILDFSPRASELFGHIRADLERKGTPIGLMDMMIAAHAISSDCILVTNNLKEFNRVEGLKTENWAQ